MTKLLMTLGPSSINEDVITKCDAHGIFVFRINLSHTPIEKLEGMINTIRSHTDTPICLDSEGAQIRNEKMKTEETVFIQDSTVKIHYEEVIGDAENISLTPRFVAAALVVGDVLDIDFHAVQLEVTSVHDDHCCAKVLRQGKVGSSKASDVKRTLALPPLSQRDEQAIEVGRRMNIKHYALSFASCREDVAMFRKKIGEDSFLISKVESRPGVRNLTDIVELSDAILIDRGDLSRQVPIKKIPFLQRRIISVARNKRTPVFVATNLLESMVITQGPTRAEVNDVVSTLLHGASGLVLAAETAIGKYPVECVAMIKSLVDQVDRWTPNSSIDEILED